MQRVPLELAVPAVQIFQHLLPFRLTDPGYYLPAARHPQRLHDAAFPANQRPSLFWCGVTTNSTDWKQER